MLSPGHQVRRLFVNLDHCDRIARCVEHRNVVLDEKTFWRSWELLFFALWEHLMVSGENTNLRRERFVQLVIFNDLCTDQSRVG
ncbi:hypothetical protein D3C77_723340 [compost metagenome]